MKYTTAVRAVDEIRDYMVAHRVTHDTAVRALADIAADPATTTGGALVGDTPNEGQQS